MNTKYLFYCGPTLIGLFNTRISLFFKQLFLFDDENNLFAHD